MLAHEPAQQALLTGIVDETQAGEVREEGCMLEQVRCCGIRAVEGDERSSLTAGPNAKFLALVNPETKSGDILSLTSILSSPRRHRLTVLALPFSDKPHGH